MAVAFKVSAESDAWIKNFSMLLTSADILSIMKGHQAELHKMKEIVGQQRLNDPQKLVAGENGMYMNGKNGVGEHY